MLDPDLLRRMEQARRRVHKQAAALRALRLESKALRAAASAVGDQAIAVTLATQGLLDKPLPPIPTHPPEDWGRST